MTDTPISLADVKELETHAPDAHSLTRFAPYVSMPPEVRDALVEAVSAAQAYCDSHDGYQCSGPDGQCEWDCTEAVALAAALSRFVSEQTPNGKSEKPVADETSARSGGDA